MIVNAVVLITVQKAQVDELAQALLKIEGVREVFSVAGRYDLVAIVRAKSNEAIADIVTRHIHTQEAIEDTETMLAFKSYSQDDLAGMFGIGAEEDVSH